MSKHEVVSLINAMLDQAKTEAGITETQLAKRLDTSVTQLWRWRHGYLPPSILILMPLLHRQLQPELLGLAA